MEPLTIALICVIAVLVIAAVIGCYIAFQAGIKHRKEIAEAQIGSAEQEASRIIDEARKNAESLKKEKLIEAKDEIYKARMESERELKERRSEVSRQERRVQQKEETLDKKLDSLDKKEENVQAKLRQADEKLKEADKIKASQLDMLERISQLTIDQAREYLLKSLEDDLVHEKAMKIANYEQQAKEECEAKARQLISLAIARCAADQVSESAVSVVPLPNDEMKGRIIGREGRNIRALEQLTGVDLIIDDTPEAITLSCFDPVRREVARIALEKLIQDGRIHPTRIEEMVDKARREVEQVIKSEGERAVLEANIHGLNHELIKLIGRLHYRTSYRQNVLNHSIEVAHLAGMMASELGVDPAIARRAGLLHDIGKATKLRAATFRLVLTSARSTRNRRISSTRLKPTTATLRFTQSSRRLFRRQMLSPRQDLRQETKTLKITSSVWRSLKRYAPPTRVLKNPSRSRQVVRCA